MTFKKIVLALFGAVAFLIVLALVLPFLIDFNRFKPQIKAVVAEQVYADVDFSSARLTVFPAVGVRLKDVIITNTDPTFSGTTLFRVNDLDFHLNLSKLLSGIFTGYVKIVQPEITVKQDGQRNNIASLAKPKAAGDGGSAENPPSQPSEPGPDNSKEKIEEFKDKVSIEELRIEKAAFRFVRDGANAASVDNLDIAINNIGLNRDIDTSIRLHTAVNDAAARVEGDVVTTLKSFVDMQAGAFQELRFSGKVDLGGLNIHAADGAFVKASGLPLYTEFSGIASTNSITMESVKFVVHRLEALAKLTISDFNTLNSDLHLNLSTDDIAALGDLLPKHKALLVSGNLKLDADVKGPLSRYETLQTKTEIIANLTGSDFALRASTTSLMPPKADVNLTSQTIDIAALLKPFMGDPAAAEKPAGEKPAVDPAKSESPGSDPKAAPAAEKEFELSAEQKKMLQGSDIKALIDLKNLKYDNLEIKNFILDIAHQDLTASLKRFGLDAFGGSVASTARVSLGEFPVAYQGELGLSQVDITQLIDFIAPDFKDAMSGKVTLDLNGESRGSVKQTMVNHLNAKGSFHLAEGTFNSASIAELVGKETDQLVAGLNPSGFLESNYSALKAQVPAALQQQLDLDKTVRIDELRGQLASFAKLSVSQHLAAQKNLKDLKGELVIKDGVVNFATNAKEAAGEFRLNPAVKLDGSLLGENTFVASEKTKQDLMKVTPYAKLLFNPDGQFILPFSLAGSVLAPKVAVDLTQIRKNFQGAAEAMIQAELTKRFNEQKSKLLGAGAEKLKQELAKQQEKAKAALAKEKAKLDSKTKAEKEKVKGEAKKKLEEQFKGKFPKF